VPLLLRPRQADSTGNLYIANMSLSLEVARGWLFFPRTASFAGASAPALNVASVIFIF
jgi:hypothetical protein